MDGQRKGIGFGVLAGVAGTLALLAIGAVTLVYSGGYNVAATEQHTAFVRWALDTNFHKSVRQRASGIGIPASFSSAMAEGGAAEYKEMCQHCHAGPGVERSEWANGMRPVPPHLTEAASEWQPNEVFWLLKHGVKMSGMPAFGEGHDDETLWNLVAFVKELPAMTPESYAAFPSSEDHGSANTSAH